jgi:phosphoadenosine phosphosulfate reductase
MLNENTLWGERDKVAIAIERIRTFEPTALSMSEKGYHVCISGGKDSSVIQQLCIKARVKCEFVHSHTSVDFPETVFFIRGEKERIEKLGYDFCISIPRYSDGTQKTMWNGIVKHGLPTRCIRWCCAELKEYSGKGKYIVTGVRWDESVRRRKRGIHEFKAHKKENRIILNNDNDMKRKITETCLNHRTFVLNPIIDWSEDDVWEFLRNEKVPVNPLYKQGYKRVGCMGCPMNPKSRKKEFEKMPKYRDAYFRAAVKYLQHRKIRGLPTDYAGWKTPEKYFEWWLNG